MKKNILFLCLALATVQGYAQQRIHNVDFYTSGESIVITYDFTGTQSQQRYDMQLFVSFNGGSWQGPLRHVSGDIGSNNSGGTSKRITWNALQEYTAIEHNLAFRITATCTQGCNTNDGMDMVFIQGGTFSMGSNERDNEKPIHSVTVSSFYMGKYEVTVEQFREFVNATNYKTDAERGDGSYVWYNGSWEQKAGINWRNNTKGGTAENNHPVIHVSWNDVTAYIQWLAQKTGKNYRLPTEAEWEYAAKGGKNCKYAGSDNINNAVWYTSNNSNNIYPVGQMSPNGYGLYDMTGNVWEWCSDWYGSDYYKNSPSNNPKGPSSGTNRVLRGGSWNDGAGYCLFANRNDYTPDFRFSLYGFRLAL